MQYLHIAILFPVCIKPPSYMLSERSRQILRPCVTNLEVNMFCVLWKRIDGDILTRAQMFYWIYHDSVAHLSSLIFFSPIAFSLYHDHLRLYAIFNTYTLMILRWNPGGIEVAYSFSKLHGTPFFPPKVFFAGCASQIRYNNVHNWSQEVNVCLVICRRSSCCK